MMPERIVLKLPKLYLKQREAIFSPARYSVIEASTKSGKTVGCITWIISEAWLKGKEGRSWWWIAPTFTVARIAFRRVRRMLQRVDPEHTVWTCNETESRIKLMSGGEIWFKGGDDPDSLYGEDVWGAVIDESSRVKEDSWFAVRSTLTKTQGHIRIIGNVKGRKNWAYNIARKAQSGEKDMAYFKLTAWDAVEGGVLEAQEIEDAKRMLPENIFRELYLAEPSDDGGNPFGLAAIAKCVQQLSPADVRHVGIDLAKSRDWTVVCGLDTEGRVCLLDRWQSDWGATRTRINSLCSQRAVLADSTGVGDPIVEDLQRQSPLVQGFKFTAASKQQLMEGLAAAIQRQEIGFPDGWLRNELDAFEYEYTRTGVRYTAPDGLHDDGVCALALAWRLRTQGCDIFPFTVRGAEMQVKREVVFDREEIWSNV